MKHILIVEDDELMRNTLREGISSNIPSAKISVASNPVDALEVFHKEKSSISHVIVDYFMPIDNGIEFCKVVKGANTKIEVILFTGNKEIENSPELANVDKLIFKPNAKELIDYLNS